MRSRSKNFGSVFLVNRKAVLGVILLSAISYALANSGVSESAVTGVVSHIAVPNTAMAPSQMVWMRVTAYCPCRRCCGRHSDGKTASGHKIKRGDTFIAADKKHSFGTKMIVPGYNNSQLVKVLDRGRAIRGNRLDVFFNSHRKARKWGVKYLRVKVHRINSFPLQAIRLPKAQNSSSYSNLPLARYNRRMPSLNDRRNPLHF